MKLILPCGHVLEGAALASAISVDSYQCGKCESMHEHVEVFCDACRESFTLKKDPLYK